MARNKLPPEQAANLKGEVVTETTTALMKLSSMGRRVTGKAADNQLFRDRIAAYLDFCVQNEMRPGIETAAVSLGTTRKTLWSWSCGLGCDGERQADAAQFKQFLDGLLEQYGLSQAINPVYAIWLQKNWSGYSDAMELRTVENMIGESRQRQTAEEIMKRYTGTPLPILEDEDDGND